MKTFTVNLYDNNTKFLLKAHAVETAGFKQLEAGWTYSDADGNWIVSGPHYFAPMCYMVQVTTTRKAFVSDPVFRLLGIMLRAGTASTDQPAPYLDANGDDPLIVSLGTATDRLVQETHPHSSAPAVKIQHGIERYIRRHIESLSDPGDLLAVYGSTLLL